MRMSAFAWFALGVLALTALHVAPAAAQATRTWVSGVGDDANPCSRTAPCKTFAGAISKTAASGTISVLDPGGYGALTITKAISIQTDPAFGSILNTTVSGIIVNAGATDDVYINGLIIDGSSLGLNGVQFLSGRSLTMTNCAIRGNTGSPGTGVAVSPTVTESSVSISGCTITGNKVGVRANPTGTGVAKVTLDNVRIDHNANAGIRAAGSKARVYLSNSVVSFNAPGLRAVNGGKIISYGNNVIANNNPNGAPSAVHKLK